MNIRGTSDRVGAIQGYYHIAGDITFEVTADVLVYFMYASRVTPAKGTITGGGYPYTFTPANVASPSTAAGATNRKSLSIQINRNNRPFGYTGCNVTRSAFRVENGVLLCTATVMGLDETQAGSVGSPTWPTTAAMGPTYNNIEIPTATARTDLSTFTLTIDDTGVPENRIKTAGGRAPQFIKWGEREITMTTDVDFDALTDYNVFLAQTLQAVKFTSVVDANLNAVAITLPVTVVDTFGPNLDSLGDIVSANMAFHAIDTGSPAYSMVVNTAESIT
jgi:hypothetical protein